MSLFETIINIIVDEFTSRETREFHYLTNDALQLIKKENIKTGSYHEGFVNHGDKDKMYVDHNFLVVDCIEDITDDIDENIGILIIDSQDCKPGYVRLLVHKEPLLEEFFKGCYCLHTGKKYLNAKMLIEKIYSIAQEIPSNIDHLIHGPAVKTRNTDLVLGLQCKENLKSTEQFLQQLPSHISNQNINLFCFVRKSHQYSHNPDIEFRWSFSIIEYNLIRQFTDKEFQLHFLCKELYNTYIKSNNDENENCISSYTVKTIILYLLERHKDKIKSKSIINLVKLFLCELKCRLQKKNLSHYFIREYNLFDVLEDAEAKEVLRSIENIEKDLFSAILNCRIFIKHESFVTLCSVYRISNKMSDVNMQEDLLSNILKERSIQQVTPDLTMKDLHDHFTYQFRITDFLIDNPLRNYFDVLCIYFHCHSIFEGKYSCSTITIFKDSLTRFLPLYLVGLASKNHRRSIIHLLIETLLLRSIYLPNPVPSINYNAKIPLAFYYYLCNEKEKALGMLFDSTESYIEKTGIMLVSGGYNFHSVVSNDIILKELFESETLGTILHITSRFMFDYIMFRMTMKIRYIETLEKDYSAETQLKDELRIIDILMKTIISSLKHFV